MRLFGLLLAILKVEAKIRWMSWQSGFQLLRPVIKTADGKYCVGDNTDGPTADWHQHEIVVADVRWLALNPMTAQELVVDGRRRIYRGLMKSESPHYLAVWLPAAFHVLASLGSKLLTIPCQEP
jgi:hypothetical protein